MEILVVFYLEALRFLGVLQDRWAETSMGMALGGTEKASIISINYAQPKILVSLPVMKMIKQSSPKTAGDTSSVYQSYGYK